MTWGYLSLRATSIARDRVAEHNGVQRQEVDGAPGGRPRGSRRRYGRNRRRRNTGAALDRNHPPSGMLVGGAHLLFRRAGGERADATDRPSPNQAVPQSVANNGHRGDQTAWPVSSLRRAAVKGGIFRSPIMTRTARGALYAWRRPISALHLSSPSSERPCVWPTISLGL